MGNYISTDAYAIVFPAFKPTPVEKGEKNEKISDTITRHRCHYSNLCFAGSGNGRRRSLIKVLTISFYCETEKNTDPVTCVFFCGIAVTLPTMAVRLR